MNDLYEIYYKAANLVENGWIQGQLMDGRGNVCMVGSIMQSIPFSYRGYETPEVIVDEIGRKLRFKPVYLFFRMVRVDKERAIMAWNDAPLRRQSSVVKVLHQLALDHQPLPNVGRGTQRNTQQELRKLREQVQALETEKAIMSARITRLEAENARLWRRLLSQRDLTSDREVLERLDVELDSVYTKIESMSR